MKLVVISHTPHYKNKNGVITGWGPTVREIDFLSELFDTVVHIAPLSETPMPESAIPYASHKVEFVALRPAGGFGLWKKLGILVSIPGNLKIILFQIRSADWVHVRLPTNLGLYVLPLLSLIPDKHRWIKYAGNWIQKNAPLSFSIQRWWLARNWQRSFVTINGKWPQQPEHLLSFENPCFTEREMDEAKQVAAQKEFGNAKIICFVGALDPAKGILQLVRSLGQIRRKQLIEKLIVVGDGLLMDELKRISKVSPVPVEFLGYLPRHAINAIYEQSHIVVLPSDSEGFPKVITEGASYGCIPIVTDVSSISQYVIDGENGFLIKDNAPESIAQAIDYVLESDRNLEMISSNATKMARRFTFERYVSRVRDEILSSLIKN